MAVEALEDYSRREFSRGERARRIWVVSGTNSETLALDAPGVGGSAGVAHENDTHPNDARLFARKPSARQLTVNHFEVEAEYYRPVAGPPTDNGEKLPILEWNISNVSEAIDRDNLGLPIINSAGDIFEPKQTIEVASIYFRIRRLEDSFDTLFAAAFMNRVNADTFTALTDVARVVVPPRQLRCVLIAPTYGYTPKATEIEISFEFEWRMPTTSFERDSSLISTHDFRILDQGLNGWYSDSGTAKPGRFFYPGGREVTEPIRLDGQGKPLDTTIKVKDASTSPVFNPTQIGVAAKEIVGRDAVYLWYRKYPQVSFQGLSL